eukprot:Skav236747  [mRNA]  locus=scaffold2899:106997:108354:- [translate_table: standard]
MDFTPPARPSSRGGRRAESLSAEPPGSQARRKLEELAVELGAPTATAHGGQRDSMVPATSQLGRDIERTVICRRSMPGKCLRSGMAMIVKSQELRNQRLQKGIAATAKASEKKLSQPKAKQGMLATHHDQRERTPSFSQRPKLEQILGVRASSPLAAVMPYGDPSIAFSALLSLSPAAFIAWAMRATRHKLQAYVAPSSLSSPFFAFFPFLCPFFALFSPSFPTEEPSQLPSALTDGGAIMRFASEAGSEPAGNMSTAA